MRSSARDALEQLRQLLEPLAERFELDDPGRGLVAVIPVVGGTFIHPLTRATIPRMTVYGAGPDVVKIVEPRFLRTLPRMPVAGIVHASQFCAYVAKSLSQRLGELGAVRDRVAALGIGVDLEHDVLRLHGRVELQGIRVRVTTSSAEALVVTALGERDLPGIVPRPERTLALTAAPTQDLDDLARMVDRLDALLRGETSGAPEPAPAVAPPPAELSPWDTPPPPAPATPEEPMPSAQDVPAVEQPVEPAGAPLASPASDAPATAAEPEPPDPVAAETAAPDGQEPPGAEAGEEEVIELLEPLEGEEKTGTPEQQAGQDVQQGEAAHPEPDVPAEQARQAEPAVQPAQQWQPVQADQPHEDWRVAQPVVPQPEEALPEVPQPEVQQPAPAQPQPETQQPAPAQPAGQGEVSLGMLPVRELFDKLGSEAEVTAYTGRLRLVVPMRIVQGTYTFYLEQNGPTSFKGVLQSPGGTRHPVAFDLRAISDIKEIADRVLMGH